MLENLKNYKIVLASQSPRRQELLKMMNINFAVENIAGLEESYPPNMPVAEIPLYLALQKQSAYKHIWSLENHLVITADTIVSLENTVLGKPSGRNGACEMLMMLSGKTHEVITGVSIKSNNKSIDFTDITHVSFKELTSEMIEYYVDNFQPYDKAGAYGIQEWIGLTSIREIRGSYFNVMGLPVDRLYDELLKF